MAVFVSSDMEFSGADVFCVVLSAMIYSSVVKKEAAGLVKGPALDSFVRDCPNSSQGADSDLFQVSDNHIFRRKSCQLQIPGGRAQETVPGDGGRSQFESLGTVPMVFS